MRASHTTSGDLIRPRRPRRRGIALAGAAVLVAVASLLPTPGARGQGGTSLGPVDRGALGGLLQLPDDQVPVLYVAGALDRAARLQLRLKEVYGRLAGWAKLDAPFRVLVISPREWQTLELAEPYGFPVRLDLSTAAVPAWGTPESVELWRALLGRLPRAEGFAARGSQEELASLVLADSFLELELCRTVAHRLEMAGGAEGLWLNDLLGQVMCTAADRLREEPAPLSLLPLLEAGAGGSTAPPPLETYGADLETSRWMAYQAHFARGAEIVWQQGGKQGVRRLVRKLRRKGQPLVFEDLLASYPDLADWRSRAGG